MVALSETKLLRPVVVMGVVYLVAIVVELLVVSVQVFAVAELPAAKKQVPILNGIRNSKCIESLQSHC